MRIQYKYMHLLTYGIKVTPKILYGILTYINYKLSNYWQTIIQMQASFP